MNIAIVGLGLIGGSLAKTIKKHTEHVVIGLDQNREVLTFAHSVGAVDVMGDADALGDADVTILCIYPEQMVPYVLEHREDFRPGSIVTDTAGVKQGICAALEAEALPFTFIGGHPMAGREVTGFENALEDMFEGASFLFTPRQGEDPDKVQVLVDLAKEMKFQQSIVTTPRRHDEMIAYTSQIAHVLACAYVLSPRAKEHKGFSAGSFRDVSRVAKINEELWTQLFLENGELLVEEIDSLQKNLAQMRRLIQERDEPGLKAVLRRGREVKEELDR
ncbi:MAG: prephenate dehydrogenase [Clostridiales bacterium]|nr:prephenate dehydrogenase [Clostridiales bacterium]